MNYFLYI